MIDQESPDIQELIRQLQIEQERRRVSPFYIRYDESNLIPFTRLHEIGERVYGPNWKRYLTTHTRDFSGDPTPITDLNIAIGCLCICTLDGTIGSLTHVLDSADPEKAVEYVLQLTNQRAGTQVIIVGGRDRMSETLLTTFEIAFQRNGYIISAKDVLGDEYGRLATHMGSEGKVRVVRRKRVAGETTESYLYF